MHFCPLIIVWSCLSYTASTLKIFSSNTIDPCYDPDEQRPRRCMPDFVNAAFGAPIESSSTCGQQRKEMFCDLKNVKNRSLEEYQCHNCDLAGKKYSTAALTDIHNSNNVTCWRSEPRSLIADPGSTLENVTLTLSLGKKYELTYISLAFCPQAVKPDSLAIYKSPDYGKTWLPFQFYSSQCRSVFGRPANAEITKANEQQARCIDHQRSTSDGMAMFCSRIAFSTLEGRPSSKDFDASPVLQEWVTATDIRVVFHSLQNPFKSDQESNIADRSKNSVTSRDSHHFKQSQIISAVNTFSLSDFAVGGRCKCNGHASKCITGRNGVMGCECKHNTAGRDCERCKQLYLDRPWARATARNANECKGICINIFSLNITTSA